MKAIVLVLVLEFIGVAAAVNRSHYQHSIGLLVDLLQHEVASPIAVVLFASCWPPSDHVRLFKITPLPIKKCDHSAELPDGVSLTVLDLNCKGALDLLLQTNLMALSHPRRWLIFNNRNATMTSNGHIWENIPIWVDSHITVAMWNGTGFGLSQVYNLQEGGRNRAFIETIGNWHPLDEPRLRDNRKTQILSRRRRNLMRIPLTVSFVVVNNDTINHLTDDV